MNLLVNDKRITQKLEIADNFLKRIKGLIGKKSIDENYGLFIPCCNSVHTFFMQCPIDIVMTDKNFKVIYLREFVNPFKIIICFKAYHTFEFAAGIIKKVKIKNGDFLKIV
ncbi:MAG: DUF192 domain-containing protein [Candidatus Goldbacteria bacterium]|nr:DUF192 domain-containing protein [Candidatus Goldiibacteriota bacterium]